MIQTTRHIQCMYEYMNELYQHHTWCVCCRLWWIGYQVCQVVCQLS